MMHQRSIAEVELGRSEVWTRLLLLDIAARDWCAIREDGIVLGCIYKRVARALEPTQAKHLSTQLDKLRNAIKTRDLRAAATATTTFREILLGLSTSPV